MITGDDVISVSPPLLSAASLPRWRAAAAAFPSAFASRRFFPSRELCPQPSHCFHHRNHLEYLGFVVSHQPTLPCRQKSGAETTVVVRSVSKRLARCSNRSSSVSPVPSVAESSERWSSSGAGSLNGVSFPLFRPRPVRAVSIHTCLAQPPTRGCSTSKVVPRAIFYRCWGTCVNF